MKKLLSQSNFEKLLKAIKKAAANDCEVFASYCLNYIDISYNNYYMTLDIEDIKNNDIKNASYKIIVLSCGNEDFNITINFDTLDIMLECIQNNFVNIESYYMAAMTQNKNMVFQYY